MGFRRPTESGVIGPFNFTQDTRSNRYCFESFMSEPVCYKKGALTTPAGTDLDDVIIDTGRYRFEYAFIGTHTDTLMPVIASEGGYNWVLATAVAGQGVEINFGGLKDGHPRNHVPSSENWFARILLITDDASGIDLFFGFKKNSAYVETLTEVTDLTGIRILGDSSSTTGAVTIITNANNAGSTDYTSTAVSGATPLEDATAIELEVRNVGGKAYHYINGVYVDAGVSFTYDTDDVHSPVCRLLQTTDIFAQAKTLAYEAGPLSERTDATLLSLAGSTI